MPHIAKRGRPALHRPTWDAGTPELQSRRQLHQTREAIDACLEFRLIDAESHAAAMHWRWLYTLKYGVPGPSMSKWTRLESSASTTRDTKWLHRKHCEFLALNRAIAREPAYTLFVNGCLFNRWPRFLIYLQKQKLHGDGVLPPTLARDLEDLRAVLNILKNLCRK